MSVNAWVVFPKECSMLKKPGEILSFKNIHVIFHSSVAPALEEARGIGEQTVVCRVELDDITCTNALTAVQYGDTLDLQALLKEYFEYPFPYEEIYAVK